MHLDLQHWIVKLAFIVVSVIVLIGVVGFGGYIISRPWKSSTSIERSKTESRVQEVTDPHAPDRFVTTSVPLYDKNGGHALDPSGMFYVITDRYLRKQYVVFTVSTSATTLSNIDCTSE